MASITWSLPLPKLETWRNGNISDESFFSGLMCNVIRGTVNHCSENAKILPLWTRPQHQETHLLFEFVSNSLLTLLHLFTHMKRQNWEKFWRTWRRPHWQNKALKLKWYLVKESDIQREAKLVCEWNLVRKLTAKFLSCCRRIRQEGLRCSVHECDR